MVCTLRRLVYDGSQLSLLRRLIDQRSLICVHVFRAQLPSNRLELMIFLSSIVSCEARAGRPPARDGSQLEPPTRSNTTLTVRLLTARGVLQYVLTLSRTPPPTA